MYFKYRSFIFFVVVFFVACRSAEDNSQIISIDLNTAPDNLLLMAENLISTPLFERDIAIHSTYDEIIFTRGDYKQKYRCLVGTKKQGDTWTSPEILTISGTWQDIEPFFANNGNRLYFSSNRPIYGDSTRSDYNIWYSDRKNNKWSEPIALDSIINTTGDEFYPSLSRKGTLFFTATRPNGIGREDIFKAEFVNGKFNYPEPLSASINSVYYEFNAFISPDEDYIIFSSYGRSDDLGGGDLYISEKDSIGNWAPARNMGSGVNSPYLDFCPFVDADQRNLYFTSERISEKVGMINKISDLEKISNAIENGFGNIYKCGFEHIRKKGK